VGGARPVSPVRPRIRCSASRARPASPGFPGSRFLAPPPAPEEGSKNRAGRGSATDRWRAAPRRDLAVARLRAAARPGARKRAGETWSARPDWAGRVHSEAALPRCWAPRAVPGPQGAAGEWGSRYEAALQDRAKGEQKGAPAAGARRHDAPQGVPSASGEARATKGAYPPRHQAGAPRAHDRPASDRRGGAPVWPARQARKGLSKHRAGKRRPKRRPH
jgi:hypothetical protein